MLPCTSRRSTCCAASSASIFTAAQSRPGSGGRCRRAAELLAGARRVAVVEKLTDFENLGGVFRNAAAFGIDAVLLDAECADPLYRRCVRVSIGHVLTVPWTRVDAIGEVADHGFTMVALTPAADATPDRCVRLARTVRAVARLRGTGLVARLARRGRRARADPDATVRSTR